MSKIFVVYGHHNLDNSFNQEIRDTFCLEAKNRSRDRSNKFACRKANTFL